MQVADSGVPPPHPTMQASNDGSGSVREPAPIVTANPPVFGGNANPQGDPPVITTNPPELPAPQPAAPPIPDPVPVAGLPAPITQDQGGVPPPLAPPVQLPTQNGTLGTDTAPSNPVPVPVPEPVNQPSSPSVQPVDAGGARQPENQVTQTESRLSVPSIPRITAPTNQRELLQPIPLEWTQPTGATYYILAVADQTSSGFPVNDERVGPPPFRRTFAAGHYFTFDVRACNQAGCSERSANGSFRTGGVPSQTSTARNLTYDDVLSPRERGIFDEHFDYLARVPESNPPAKFTPDHIKRMQDDGRWKSYIIGIENDNKLFSDIGANKTDYCGSGFTASVPDRIFRTDISSACKTHDACYSSSSTQLRCDIGIMKDIYAICRAKGSSPICYYAAYKYFEILNQIGRIAYRNAQKKRR
jgi:hypothetical protein